MSSLRERRQLDHLIFQHGLTAWEARAAYVLLEVKGFENAKGYVEGVKESIARYEAFKAGAMLTESEAT
ncbi:MAG: hypothetical protein V2A73_06785 [Pseudomonadota bacterium]